MGLNKRLIGAGATASGGLTPSENFKVVTYTGDGAATHAITGVGFQPDVVWIQNRTGDHSPKITNSSRGSTKYIYTNQTQIEQNYATSIKSFDADGFTLGSETNSNQSGLTYVAWCFKVNGGTTSSNTDGTNIDSTIQVNADVGISLVEFTTPSTFSGSNTVGHGLGSTPDMILVHATSVSEDWYVYHTGTGLNKATRLNTSDAVANATYLWGTVNDTVFNPAYTSTSPITNIAFCFKSIDGFSKFGSYTGNGSANGPIVETGFEPAFIMVKNTTSSGQDWRILDNKRNTVNPRNCYLSANNSNTEECQYDQFDFLSNGFQAITTDGSINQNASNFIYMAFAADPDTEAPTLASSFNIETYSGTGSAQTISGLGFSPNLVWLKHRNNPTAHQHNLLDTVRTNGHTIHSNSNAASEAGINMISSYTSDGFILGTDNAVNQSGINHVAWTWKADDNEPTLFGGPAAAVYKFEDNYNDVTGTYNGSGTSGTSFISGGKFNKAVAFSGTSSNMDTGITARNFESWSFWFKPASSNTGYRVLVSTNTSGDVGQNFEYSSSNSFYIVDILGGATNNNASVTIDLRDGNWHHVVLTKTATKFTAYLDKQEKISVTNATGSSLQKGNEWSFGKGNYGDANSDFKIDQARYFESVLEQEDINKLYAETEPDNDDLSFGSPKETIISANANAGFSIVKYTGIGADMKVPHGLSAAPDMLIVKGLETTNDWSVLHKDGSNGDFLQLNGSSAESGAGSIFGSTFTRPTATVFTVGNTGETGTVDKQYIAYCFHDVAGYQKFGSYTGDGSTQSITTGFKVDFLLIKESDGTDSWELFDSRRGVNKVLYPNGTNAEGTTSNLSSFNSNGFTVSSATSVNENGKNYIYWAVAKNVPSNTTLANSFKAVTYTGTGGSRSVTGVGFQPDLIWMKRRNTAQEHALVNAVSGVQKHLNADLNAVESTETNGVSSFDSDGFTVGANGLMNNTNDTYIAWAWKAGNTWQSNLDGSSPSTVNVNTANGFSIVKYVGNQTAGHTIGHGLGAVPQVIILKCLIDVARPWYVYHVGVDASNPAHYNLRLNNTDARQDSTTEFNDTAPTSSVFTLGTASGPNGTGDDYIAYCWTPKSGYSKFGSFTGNGSSQSITGLGFQPDWVMIKGVSSGGNGGWYIFDSERNAQNYLRANLSNAESTGADSTLTSFDSDGFTLGNDGVLNGNTYTYIYMAFKMN